MKFLKCLATLSFALSLIFPVHAHPFDPGEVLLCENPEIKIPHPIPSRAEGLLDTVPMLVERRRFHTLAFNDLLRIDLKEGRPILVERESLIPLSPCFLEMYYTGKREGGGLFGRGWYSTIDPFKVEHAAGKWFLLFRGGEGKRYNYRGEENFISPDNVEKILAKKEEYDRELGSLKHEPFYESLKERISRDLLLYTIFLKKFGIEDKGKKAQTFEEEKGEGTLIFDGGTLLLRKGDGTVLEIAPDGRVLSISLPGECRLDIEYNDGVVAGIRPGEGEVLKVGYEGGRINAIDGGEFHIEYIYEGEFLKGVRRRSGIDSTFGYDPQGLLTEIVTRGIAIKFLWKDLELEEVLLEGHPFFLKRKPGGRSFSITGGGGKGYLLEERSGGLYILDSLGREFFLEGHELHSPYGWKHEIVPLAEGRPYLLLQGPDRVEFGWEKGGLLSRLLFNDTPLRRFSFDTAGELNFFGTPEGEWRIERDGMSLKVSGQGRSLSLRRDRRGLPVSLKVPGISGHWKGEVSSEGRTFSLATPSGRRVEGKREDGSVVIESSSRGEGRGGVILKEGEIILNKPEGRGRLLLNDFNLLGRVEKGGEVVELHYGEDFSLVSFVRGGKTTRIERPDTRELLLREEGLTPLLFSFDPAGRLKRVKKGEKDYLSLRFKGTELSRATLQGVRDMEIEWDDRGRPERFIPSGGREILFSFDGLNRPSRMEAEGFDPFIFDYEGGYIRSVKRGGEEVLAAGFDPSGRPSMVEWREGGRVLLSLDQWKNRAGFEMRSDGGAEINGRFGDYIEARYGDDEIRLNFEGGLLSGYILKGENYRILRDGMGRIKGVYTERPLKGVVLFYPEKGGLLVSGASSPLLLNMGGGGSSLFAFGKGGKLRNFRFSRGEWGEKVEVGKSLVTLEREMGLLQRVKVLRGGTGMETGFIRDSYGRVRVVRGEVEISLERDELGRPLSLFGGGIRAGIETCEERLGKAFSAHFTEYPEFAPLSLLLISKNGIPLLKAPSLFRIVNTLLYLHLKDPFDLACHALLEEGGGRGFPRGLPLAGEGSRSSTPFPLSMHAIYPVPSTPYLPLPPFPFQRDTGPHPWLPVGLTSINDLFKRMEGMIRGDPSSILTEGFLPLDIRFPGLALDIEPVRMSLEDLNSLLSLPPIEAREGWERLIPPFLTDHNESLIVSEILGRGAGLGEIAHYLDLYKGLSGILMSGTLGSYKGEAGRRSPELLLGTNPLRMKEQKGLEGAMETALVEVDVSGVKNSKVKGEGVVELFEKLSKRGAKSETPELFSCTEGLILDGMAPFSGDCPFTHASIHEGPAGREGGRTIAIPLSVILFPWESSWEGLMPDTLRKLSMQRGYILLPDPFWEGWKGIEKKGGKG